MTLIQMRYFYEVCQWQNITKAAEHLHVSQPTISVAMQTLETETGLNLFPAGRAQNPHYPRWQQITWQSQTHFGPDGPAG
jgi:DNA-binding transcriptional LysR family regulator